MSRRHFIQNTLAALGSWCFPWPAATSASVPDEPEIDARSFNIGYDQRKTLDACCELFNRNYKTIAISVHDYSLPWVVRVVKTNDLAVNVTRHRKRSPGFSLCVIEQTEKSLAGAGLRSRPITMG
jgi:hypothetical protein